MESLLFNGWIKWVWVKTGRPKSGVRHPVGEWIFIKNSALIWVCPKKGNPWQLHALLKNIPRAVGVQKHLHGWRLLGFRGSPSGFHVDPEPVFAAAYLHSHLAPLALNLRNGPHFGKKKKWTNHGDVAGKLTYRKSWWDLANDRYDGWMEDDMI